VNCNARDLNDLANALLFKSCQSRCSRNVEVWRSTNEPWSLRRGRTFSMQFRETEFMTCWRNENMMTQGGRVSSVWNRRMRRVLELGYCFTSSMMDAAESIFGRAANKLKPWRGCAGATLVSTPSKSPHTMRLPYRKLR